MYSFEKKWMGNLKRQGEWMIHGQEKGKTQREDYTKTGCIVSKWSISTIK